MVLPGIVSFSSTSCAFRLPLLPSTNDKQLLGTIYLIAHRKIHPPTVDDLRKEIMRTENVNEIALTLAEFIEKKGDENWVGPMIDTVGPWAMVQLADAANFMEILRK